MSNTIATGWLAHNGAQLHPDVQISPASGSFTSTAPMPAATALLSVPSSAALSTANGSLIQRAPALSERAQWPALILTIMYECSLLDSKWRAYLDSLPREFDTLMYWTDDELRELEGSAVLGKIGKDESMIMYQAEIMVFAEAHREIFQDVDMSLETFHRVGSWIMAFSSDFEKPVDENAMNDDDEDDDDDERFDSLNSDKVMVPFANLLPGDCALTNCEWTTSASAITLTATKDIPAGGTLYTDPGALPRSDLLRRLGAFPQSSARHDVIEIDSTLIISVAGKALSESARDARIERLVDEELLEDSYDIEVDGAIPSDILVVVQAFAVDDATFQSYVEQERYPKAKKDGRARDVLLEVVRKRREGYRTTGGEDVALLRGGEMLLRRRRMAVEVRLGEKEILGKMEGVVRGWGDVEEVGSGGRERKRQKVR
ncbi:hypothetical protein DRE_06195 [Drechslerella stenobrocha 248]|uniref:Rubisco LSMT substrate-binding domain-containing protein n=1 Tax=Drechslerella stenobrocha 248 TaxID=1043628 RepID=W7HM43_9PEZI|nr:hypothetical protein DRE_06195 [Drechslerella stenobrocha 248]